MDHFTYKNGVLHAEDVPLARIAEEVGTPVYIYSRATLERHARVFREALDVIPRKHIAFAIKANPNVAVLKVLARQGFGADIVSGGEMKRALAAGMPAKDIVFSGVGKTRAELREGLEAGIGQFISTGKKENKFGVPIDEAPGIFARLSRLPGLNLRGLAAHIGSQIFDLGPIEAAYGKLGELVRQLRAAGHHIDRVDLGGGLGVPYERDKVPPTPADYGAMVARATKDWDVTLYFEPGRVIVGNAGVLLTRVIWVKPGAVHPFIIVDAAMNVVKSGALAVFRTAGAYGATMASTYNSRALVPEVMVDGDKFAVVAERMLPETVIASERMPDFLRA